GSSCSSTFIAPRNLNEPPVCRFSHLKYTSQPTRASKAAERMTGVRDTWGPMRDAAATTSENSGMRGVTIDSGTLVGCREQVLAVIRQLADRLADVRHRLVFALLGEAAHDPGRPAPRQLLERTDVEIAVVEELLERRHVACEEAPVLADAVAAHRRGIRLDQHVEEFERALLGT